MGWGDPGLGAPWSMVGGHGEVDAGAAGGPGVTGVTGRAVHLAAQASTRILGPCCVLHVPLLGKGICGLV